ncbi:hypothetical protein RO3G_05407 [Lichtheimia corymbifera JMRC:FSU:9682]|uniref:Uncharacterized protein n=1 Tax=Lichtheimia corymbifera JMRC:FSU:9682 TaxID=1263082 RepID=A0A068RLA2_9FUNG|nr:hypothetical protein RO3G_05407 [Lichtheimia corymbifera JMRC:FSU:9682]
MEASSGNADQDFNNSLEATYKLVGKMTSTLKMELRSKQEAKCDTALSLAVFGVQCIKNRLTLMKTTLEASNKWQVLEMRSAIIPTTWNERANLLKIFEL